MCAVQPYAAALVGEVAKAERHAGGVLDQPVGPLGTGVGDAGGDERQRFGPPGVDRLGEGDQLGDAGVDAPAGEPKQPLRDHRARCLLAGAGQQSTEFFLGDPRGQDLSGGLVVDQVVPHPGERALREAFTAAQQAAPVGPFRIGGPAPAPTLFTGDALAHSGESLARERDQVEVVDDDDGMRQRLLDRGAVAGSRVDRHHPHLALPPRPALVEPVDDGLAGTAGGLAEQPTGPGQVNEVGLEPLGPGPFSTHLVLDPLGFTPASLIDAQHPRRLGLGQDGVGVGGEVAVHQRPAHLVLAAHRGYRAAGGDLAGRRPAQPARHPRPRRDLGHRLGERLARTQRLGAGELPLVPAHPQRLWAVGKIARAGRAPLAHPGGDDPALRAGRPLLGAFDMHQPPRLSAVVGDAFDLHHRDFRHAEQNRSTVVHSLWPPSPTVH